MDISEAKSKSADTRDVLWLLLLFVVLVSGGVLLASMRNPQEPQPVVSVVFGLAFLVLGGLWVLWTLSRALSKEGIERRFSVGVLFWLSVLGALFAPGALSGLFILASLGFGGWWIFRSRQTAIEQKGVRYRKSVITEILKHFGSDPDQREKEIQRVFDAATENITVEEKTDLIGSKLEVTFSSNLGALHPSHREALRIAYILINRELIPEHPFWAVRSAIVYNQGSAVVDSWNLGMGIVERYHDHNQALQALLQQRGIQTPQAAESAIRNYLDQLTKTQGDHPTVKMLNARTKGGGAWLTAEDVPGTILDGFPHAPFFCSLGPLDGEPAILAYRGEGSLISIGRPGSGKTQCHAIPALIAWKGSAIVLDIKGEIYQASAQLKRRDGEVIRFSPFEQETSSYNLLSFLPSDPSAAWVASEQLASVLHPSGLEDNANQKHWGQASREIITAALTLEAVRKAPEARRMSHVLDVLSGAGWDDFIDDLIQVAKETGLSSAGRTAASFSQEQADAPKQFTASRTSAYMALNTWNNPAVDKASRRSDWKPADLHGRDPITLYITATLQQLQTQAAFFRAILAQHVEQLMDDRFLRPQRPILLMLDEFAQLGRMEPLKRALELGRGYGLRLWLLAQYEQQISEQYKTDGISKSCAVRSYFNPDFDTAKKLSEELGEKLGSFDGTRTPLMTPQELTGADFQDLILTLTAGCKPAKVRKVYWHAGTPKSLT